MSLETPVLDAQSLRTELMAPQPMRRAMALHALELGLDHADPKRGLSQQVASFVARGIPFYSPEDAHYREWVAKVVSYWQRLNGGEPGQGAH
jgi:hypothetical protein